MSRPIERFNEPLQVYFQPTQKSDLESWLRREYPGKKVATFIREAAMREMKGQTAEQDVVPLHLEQEDRDRIMATARELGHRDLGVFLEELALRIAQRDPDEVIALFRGKKSPEFSVADIEARAQERFEQLPEDGQAAKKDVKAA